MTGQHAIEVFSPGCAVRDDAAARVKAGPSGAVTVLDMKDPAVAQRAQDLGVRSVRAVVIDGVLADRCAGRGPDDATLKAAGLGTPLP